GTASAGAGDETSVFAGATLELQGGITVGSEVLTLGSTGAGDAVVRSVSGNNIWAGSIDMGRSTTFDVGSASEFTISGVRGGGNTLTKDGAGRLILSAANTYSGQTVVAQGFLNIRNGSALGGTFSGTHMAGGVLELESATGIAVGAEPLISDGVF